MSWQNEPARHSLSARGMRSGRKIGRTYKGKRRFTDSKEKQIVSQYLKKGLSTWELGRKYNASHCLIQNILKRQKTSKKPSAFLKTHSIIPLKLKNKIVNEYKKGSNSCELGQKYNLNPQTILNWLKEKNINVKYAHQKYHKVNEKFFSKITSKSAYVLGFWMADGCAIKKCYRVRFDQNELEPIEKIKNILGSTHYITKYKRPDANIEYSTTINSKQMYSDLQKICPFDITKKTIRSAYPNISEEADNHFIRGLFDGDGCIYFKKRNGKNRATFKLTGSKKLLKKVQEKLSKIKGVKKGSLTKQKNKNCWELNYEGIPQTIKIANWLYKGANTLYLNRKKKKFDEIMVTSLQKKVNVTGG
jgi:Mor family transcriptional regulator